MDMWTRARRALPGIAILAVVASGALALSTHDLQRTVAGVSAAKVISLTNEERYDAGISALAQNALLDQAAQMKAEDMARKGYYAHVSPEGVTPVHWVQESGYKYLIIGENLVVQRTDAKQVVDAFMGSPGHRANILRKDFTEIGVGVANGTYKGKDTTFTVQIFAAPYPRTPVGESSKVSVKQNSIPPTPAAVTEKPVVATVPRPVVPTPVVPDPVPSTPNPALGAISAGPIDEKVKVLIKPLLPSLQETESIASSSASSTRPSPIETIRPFFLNEAPPVDIADVSRLETKTPPVPVGSMWSMQFRAFVEGVVLSARGLFKS